MAEHVLVKVGDALYHTKLQAFLRVGRYYYLGPLAVKMSGFRNENDGSLSTKKLTTDFVDPSRIERGEMPGWVKLSTDKDLAIKVMLQMAYSDALPESAEEMNADAAVFGSE